MKYTNLYSDSICNNCVGCGKLEINNFKGIRHSAKKDDIPCKNFKECYSEEERANKLREENVYGSMYGNNN